jgi:hypothetical protein
VVFDSSPAVGSERKRAGKSPALGESASLDLRIAAATRTALAAMRPTLIQIDSGRTAGSLRPKVWPLAPRAPRNPLFDAFFSPTMRACFASWRLGFIYRRGMHLASTQGDHFVREVGYIQFRVISVARLGARSCGSPARRTHKANRGERHRTAEEISQNLSRPKLPSALWIAIKVRVRMLCGNIQSVTAG